MHWAFDPTSVVREAADERTTAVRAAIFDREYRAADIKKGNLDTV